jgi:cytochrome oxidase Cu insertion factor (SCO1/SenC/PrrC family)
MCHLFRRTRNVLVLGLALLAIGVGQAREPQSGRPAAKVDLESVGPKVGASLPDFSLRDQRGEAHSLKSLLGPKGAVIVFFRSADW